MDLFYTGRRENLKHARFAIASVPRHIVSLSLHATRIYDGCQGAAYLAETIVCLQGIDKYKFLSHFKLIGS